MLSQTEDPFPNKNIQKYMSFKAALTLHESKHVEGSAIGHFLVPKTRTSKWDQVRNLSCENEFYLPENKDNFHNKDWALKLVLLHI